jgi:phosphopantothenoylcysteine decarboxylase/phosphopantothenate--cysteine ligase
MYNAVMGLVSEATVFIGAAAVADYKPAERAAIKLKKTVPSVTLQLERTHDILGTVASTRKEGLLVVGFAAETDNVLPNAWEKLRRKNLDAIVANDVSRTDSGFDAHQNAITILTSHHPDPISLPLMTKTEAAERILDQVVLLRNQKRKLAEQSQIVSNAHR